MKKNENILQYVEKYKYKYGISYADENGRLVKGLTVAASIVWIYSLFIMLISILSFIVNFEAGILDYTSLSSVFITTIVCTAAMIIGAVLFVLKIKIAGCIIEISAEVFTVLAYRPISVYGIGYVAGFYWKYAVPALVLIILSVILSAVLIRAKVKTNKLYNTLLEGLYKQYGSKDGEKLSDAEWEEFLQKYNPYKPMF